MTNTRAALIDTICDPAKLGKAAFDNASYQLTRESGYNLNPPNYTTYSNSGHDKFVIGNQTPGIIGLDHNTYSSPYGSSSSIKNDDCSLI